MSVSATQTDPLSFARSAQDIQARIEKAAKTAGRNAREITLLAVTKNQSPDALQAALESGHRTFAENRVQEARQHWGEIKPHWPDVRLHLIGALQTNKIREAVRLFDVIHTLDRPDLAHGLAKEMVSQNRALPCFVQVNTGEEPQKHGIFPRDLPDFLSLCQNLKLPVTGLMCIPPVEEPPAFHFALLAKLARAHGLTDLSMGMSGDFEKAVLLGATHVRIGTALFGAREALCP